MADIRDIGNAQRANNNIFFTNDSMSDNLAAVNSLICRNGSKVSISWNKMDDNSYDVFVKEKVGKGIFNDKTVGIIHNVKSPADLLEGMKDVANSRDNVKYRDDLWDAVSKVSAEFSYVKQANSSHSVDRHFDAFREQVAVMNKIMQDNGIDVQFLASRTSEKNVFSMEAGNGKNSHWVHDIKEGKDAIKNLDQAIEAISDEKVKSDIRKAQEVLAKDKTLDSTIKMLDEAVKNYDNEISSLKANDVRSYEVMKQIGKERSSEMRGIKVETGRAAEAHDIGKFSFQMPGAKEKKTNLARNTRTLSNTRGGGRGDEGM